MLLGMLCFMASHINLCFLEGELFLEEIDSIPNYSWLHKSWLRRKTHSILLMVRNISHWVSAILISPGIIYGSQGTLTARPMDRPWLGLPHALLFALPNP